MFAGYRKYINVLLALLLIFAGAELGLRLSGFGSFPLYDVENGVEYIPSANQSGAFQNRNRWAFNDRHMGNAIGWSPDKHPDVLLVGNSIVMGGLPYDRDDKLAPLLEKALHGSFTVWSIAAGGWSNVNEMAYFDKNPDVLRKNDVVVIEYMEGNLSGASPWPGQTIFPDRKPLFLSVYMFEKYVPPLLEGLKPVNDSGALPPVGAPDPKQLARFTQFVAGIAKTSQVLIFLYPDAKALANEQRWEQITAPVVAVCRSLSVPCVDIAREKAWRSDLYVEGVHPTPEGNRVLAGVLAENILMLRQDGKM